MKTEIQLSDEDKTLLLNVRWGNNIYINNNISSKGIAEHVTVGTIARIEGSIKFALTQFGEYIFSLLVLKMCEEIRKESYCSMMSANSMLVKYNYRYNAALRGVLKKEYLKTGSLAK